MAKGNLFLGKARGKIGDVIFSQLDGLQISRAYQPQVKNPRTVTQQVQRAIFGTVTLAGSVMSDIVDHSFDNFKEGQDSRNEFIRSNIALMRSRYNEFGYDSLNTFILPKGAKYIKPYPYMVSRGSLGSFQPLDVRNLMPFDGSSEILYSTLFRYFPGFGNGCQLSNLLITYREDEHGNVNYKFYKSRIVFNNRLSEYIVPGNKSGDIIGANGGFFSDVVDLSKCENVVTEKTYFPIGSDEEYNTFYVRFPWWDNKDTQSYIRINEGYFGSGEIVIAQTMVITQYDNSKLDPWLHSTSYFAVDTDRWDDTNDNIATYGNPSKVNKVSEYYLDQAIPNDELEPDLTIDQAISGEVMASGYSPKNINVQSSNSYGPVAEGSQIVFTLYAPSGWKFDKSEAKIFNGESVITTSWQITTVSGGSIIIFNGYMPTTTNFPANISVPVYNKGGDLVGTVAVRCTISKANA